LRIGVREPLGCIRRFGSAGKITNCQIGVFASYVSRHGHGKPLASFSLRLDLKVL